MTPASRPYLDALERCNITVQQAGSKSPCTWISSVHPGRIVDSDPSNSLGGEYWCKNLISPVYFTQAVQGAMDLGPYDAVIEVGPHAALKGPFRETSQQHSSVELPYTSLLLRSTEATQSFATALGFLWSVVPDPKIDFDQVEDSMACSVDHAFVPGPPVYRWTHDRQYWHESRSSRVARLGDQASNPLLGTIVPNMTSEQMQWSNTLRLKDFPWLAGHKIQGQTVFPATAYIAMAMETLPFFTVADSLQLVEIRDFAIHQPMVFNEDNETEAYETLFTLSNIQRDVEGSITARFVFSWSKGATHDLQPTAEGKLAVTLGTNDVDVLPDADQEGPLMVPVSSDHLYSTLFELGYGYSGSFRCLGDLKRGSRKAVGTIAFDPEENGSIRYFAPPAVLDSALQGILLAFGYPKDGQLWSLHLPTKIGTRLPFAASARDETNIQGIQGDVQIYDEDSGHCLIQMEDIQVIPLSAAVADDDKVLFYEWTWKRADPDVPAAAWQRASAEEYKLATILERSSFYYLRVLNSKIPKDHPGRADQFFQAYLNYAAHVTQSVVDGRNKWLKQSWLTDTMDDIMTITEPYANLPEFQIMHVAGTQMPRVILGEVDSILEFYLQDALLDQYYATSKVMGIATRWLADTAAQVMSRYPNMRVLEVGAGTGSATREVLSHPEAKFSTYTFTDISSGFFGTAQNEFDAKFAKQMKYAVLDIENDVEIQGLKKHSYDLVIASQVIHATKSLEKTLRNVRSLLKPGGYLIMNELSSHELCRASLIFGCLPGWWAGMEEGRILGPQASHAQWDTHLRNSGFGGVDSASPDHDALPFTISIYVSQAVDERVSLLRQPLLPAIVKERGGSGIEKLILLGGATSQSQSISRELSNLLLNIAGTVATYATLEDLNCSDIGPSDVVLAMCDLDTPAFKDLSPDRFESLRMLFATAKNILWVTQDRRIGSSWTDMIVGFARAVLWEMPDLHLQFLDFEAPAEPGATVIAECLIRFHELALSHERKEKNATLWSLEHELVVVSDGSYLIPRVAPMDGPNGRLNSTRRQVVEHTTLDSRSVSLGYSNGQYKISSDLFSQSRPDLCCSTTVTELRLISSTTQAVRTPVGFLFVCLGSSIADGSRYLFMTDSLSSTVSIATDCIFPCSPSTGFEAATVALVAASMLAATLTDQLCKGDLLLIHDAPEIISKLIHENASITGWTVIPTTSDGLNVPPSGFFVNPFTGSDRLKALLPPVLTGYVDFSKPSARPSIFGSLTTRSALRDDVSTMFSRQAQYAPFVDPGRIKRILESSHHRISRQLENAPAGELVSGALDLSSIANGPGTTNGFGVLDWTSPASIAITAEPVNALFQSDRTYWFVGLSGEMGLSLCDWMIERGAKYFVLSSRNPRVSPDWYARAERRGAKIMVAKNDVTDITQLTELYETIQSKLPPVAGVAHGAMVMRDNPIRNLTFHDTQTVFGPKVQGSINLDSIFCNTALDFFIYFSSLTGVIGNAGQANYTAANRFLCGMARERRQRGLAATAIDLGMINSIGYVARELSLEAQNVHYDYGFLLSSEHDLFSIFAEAIISGRPDSGLPSEIICGLRRMGTEHSYRSAFYSYPHFACLTPKATDKMELDTQKSGAVPLSERLANAISRESVRQIVTECLVREVKSILHLNEDYELSLSSSTDELGLDSLVAVRIRTWISQNFHVNVPTLKMLQGIMIASLIEQICNETPDELIPNSNGASLKETTSGELQSVDHGPNVPDKKVLPTMIEPTTDPGSQQSEQPNHTALSSGTSDTSDGYSIATPLTGLSNTDVEASENPLELKNALIPSHSNKQQRRKQTQPIAYERSGPLSSIQKMFWFVQNLLEDKTTLNTTAVFQMKGSVDHKRLASAVRSLGRLYSILRTSFAEEDGVVSQSILPFSTLELEVVHSHEDNKWLQLYQQLQDHTYDLAQGKALRLVLLSMSSTRSYLLIGYHHLVFDGVSHTPFMANLERAYTGKPLDNQVLQYMDHAIKQRASYESGEWSDSIAFWQSQFATIPTPLPLHRSQVSERKALQKYEERLSIFRVDPELGSALRATAKKHRSTVYHVYLAAFKVLLYRFLGTEDICIGLADEQRSADENRMSIGPFLNMAPLRLKASSSETFGQAIEEAREKSLLVRSHSHIPLEVLLNELHVDRSASHTPLFQAFMNYLLEESMDEQQTFCGCELSALDHKPARLAYDFSLTVFNTPAAEARIYLATQSSLYTDADCALLSRGFEDILHEFAEATSQGIGRDWKFRDDDLSKAIACGKGPSMTITWPTLVHRFKDVAEQYPSNVAVDEIGGQSISYKHLAARANGIAGRLSASGVVRGNTVAVFQDSGIDWVASLLAILRLGAVYVPLDLGTPPQRLTLIMEDSRPSAVLIHDRTAAKFSKIGAKFNATVIDVSHASTETTSDVAVVTQSIDVAMILYTSGSTGVPKGVSLRHSGLASDFESAYQQHKFQPTDVVLQQTAYSFDLSILQIFLALSAGAQLIIPPATMRLDSVSIIKTIDEKAVTLTWATPTEYKSWMVEACRAQLSLSSWRIAFTGGEAVTPTLLELFRRFGNAGLALHNKYGPTETTCGSSITRLSYDAEEGIQGAVTVGQACANESIYILDHEKQLQPVGMPGEIYIGGAGVSPGYLNLDELSENVFVPNPFADDSYTSQGWKTMYATGDRGRLLPDGSLCILGRVGGDTEIKLNGVRIDLRDVEQTILRSSNGKLADAAVSLRLQEGSEARYLVAHVVFAGEDTHKFDRADFLDSLIADLPLQRTMCPSAIIPVNSLPRSVAGKLDRRAVDELPVSMHIAIDSTPDQPLTETEEVVRRCWEEVIPSEVLGVHRITSESNFFHVGGTSLLLIQLQRALERESGATLTLLSMFESVTLQDMASLLPGQHRRVETSIDWDEETAPEPGLDAIPAMDGGRQLSSGRQTVVLTGATGFLGQTILKTLDDNPRVDKIICIGSRDTTRKELITRFAKASYCNGDLRLPRLGLSDQEATEIFSQADTVIHNGADVSHLKTFESLRHSNFNSTKELVRLCLPRKIAFHFISTAAVSMYSQSSKFPEATVRDHPPPRDGLYGYIACKWACEVYLENVHARYHLPVTVHRPSSVMRSATDMSGPNPVPDILQNMLKFSRDLRTVPDLRHMGGFMDFVLPETCADDIVHGVLSTPILTKTSQSKDSITAALIYRHNVGDLRIPFTGLQDHLSREMQAEIEQVPFDEWVQRAEGVGMSQVVSTAFQGLARLEGVAFPHMLRGPAPTVA
ncbi:unnamed protein product [Periconia digitata]|uniref:Carrier domain-containing protein n=1 Tax=Periconia digitata TaxID=1303443 RepID=A0A9W4U3C3_9PLEO|nr:unnamed protein product [Periconia digitata]